MPRDSKPLEVGIPSQIYDLLVLGGVALDDPRARENFVTAQENRHIREYRFMGTLGMGGKFWRNNSRWYVSQYPEDATPKSELSIKRTNEALAELKKKAGNHEHP